MSKKIPNSLRAWDKDRFKKLPHADQLQEVHGYSPEYAEYMREEFKRIGQLVCTRCGAKRWQAKHTRLHGYMCQCGNQEWK